MQHADVLIPRPTPCFPCLSMCAPCIAEVPGPGVGLTGPLCIWSYADNHNIVINTIKMIRSAASSSKNPTGQDKPSIPPIDIRVWHVKDNFVAGQYNTGASVVYFNNKAPSLPELAGTSCAGEEGQEEALLLLMPAAYLADQPKLLWALNCFVVQQI